MQVDKGDSVAVRYTGRLDSGDVFDSNDDASSDPLVFVVGAQQVIPGFEAAILGLKPGESRTVRIAPEEAYGPRDENLVTRLDRKLFEGEGLEVGQHLDLEDSQGNVFHADVVSFDDESVTVDFNHHLAGQALTFDLRVESLDKA